MATEHNGPDQKLAARQRERLLARYMRSWLYWLPLALCMVALPVAVAGLVIALNADQPNDYSFDNVSSEEAAEIRAAAQEALVQAEQNNNSVDNILSFIEGGSILIGVIVGLLGFTFTLNIRDLRSDLEGQAEATQERVETTLRHREQQLEQLSNQLQLVVEETRTQISDMSNVIDRQLEEARQKAEDSFRVLSLQLLAEQQLRSRNYETAIQTLLEAYRVEKTNQTTNYLLGYIYTARRNFEAAQKHLQIALEKDKNFAPALAALGLTQRRIGDGIKDDTIKRNRYYAESESNLLKALEMDADMVDADGESYFGTLGGLYRRQQRHHDALKAYEQAVKVTPHSAYPAGNLAVLYKYTGDDEKALEAFARTEELSAAIIDDRPGDIWARLDLAQALLVREDIQQALRQYRDVISREPPVGNLESAVDALRFLAQSPTKIEGIDQVIKLLSDEIARRTRDEVPITPSGPDSPPEV
jgi:tetratricopeptide (TPR) repeat protein